MKRGYHHGNLRQALVEAALELIAEKGPQGFTLSEAAKAADVTPAAVYRHFAGRDDLLAEVARQGFDIFAALLDHVLLQARMDITAAWHPDGTVALEDMVDAYLDRLYRMVQEPVFVELFRLLLAESRRAPELIRRWHEQVVQQYRAQEQALIDACVRRGVLRDSPLTQLFSLSVAPAFLWMASKSILGQDSAYPLEQVRSIHRAMLLDQLAPR